MTFKIVLFLTICWTCFWIATYPNRVANRHFDNIRWTAFEAKRLRDVQIGLTDGYRGEEYLLDMDIISVEKMIRELYHSRGLGEQGDSRWYRFRNGLQFQRKEEVVIQSKKILDPSPILEKVTYYAHKQRDVPPSLQVGEGEKRNELVLEVIEPERKFAVQTG